LVLCVT